MLGENSKPNRALQLNPPGFLRGAFTASERLFLRVSIFSIVFVFLVCVGFIVWHEYRIHYIETTRFTAAEGETLRQTMNTLSGLVVEIDAAAKEQYALMLRIAESQTEILRNQKFITEAILPLHKSEPIQ